MSGRLRVAIVGTGVGRAHLAGFLAHPELFQITVVCDLDAGRAAGLAAEAPGAAVETALEATLRRGDVDLVDLCLPPVLHRDAILRAFGAGKHVICEKPLVGSLAQLDEVETAARITGRTVLPVYQYRFGNGFQKLLHLIAAGLAGRPLVATLETHWNRDDAYYAVPWRGRRAGELGGAVLSHAIHLHDLLTTALGPVARVAARTAVRVNPIETEDCAAILLAMASGALVTSSITLGAAQDTSRLRFCFAGLTAESGLEPYRPGSEPWTFTARPPEGQAGLDAALAGWVPAEEGFARLFALHHRALAGGGPLPVTLDEARASLELVTAIYHAARTGEMVTLPLAADHPGYRGWLPAGAQDTELGESLR
jgi:predicted dehydrogenase